MKLSYSAWYSGKLIPFEYKVSVLRTKICIIMSLQKQQITDSIIYWSLSRDPRENTIAFTNTVEDGTPILTWRIIEATMEKITIIDFRLISIFNLKKYQLAKIIVDRYVLAT